MELKSKELLMIEEGLNALIELHEAEIEEIKTLDESQYKTRLSFNKFRENPLTLDDCKQLDIEKQLNRIKEINELKEKLFLSNSYLLVVSNRIKLSITDK